MTELTSATVDSIFRDCLFLDEEIERPGEMPEGGVTVEGVLGKFELHSERLEGHRGEVAEMLHQLPDDFIEGAGGGMSFVNACDTKDGKQWTGLHSAMDQLFVLGIGLKLCKWTLPREMWSVLPGGMPYVTIKAGLKT